jgi:hypothetical protein
VFCAGQGHVGGLHLDGPHDVRKVVVKVSAAYRKERGAK